jgi:hypothetical protein
MEKRKLVVLFEDFMKQDIENDVVIDRQEIYIESLEKRAKSLGDQIASNEYAYSKANQYLSQMKGQLISKCPFVVIHTACILF